MVLRVERRYSRIRQPHATITTRRMTELAAMKDFLRQIVAFEEGCEVTGDLGELAEDWGRERLGYSLRPFLWWLGSRANSTDKPPLCWETCYVWAPDISSLVARVQALSNVFQIDGNCLDFRSGIATDLRDEIEQFVFQEYRPRVFVTPREDEEPFRGERTA